MMDKRENQAVVKDTAPEKQKSAIGWVVLCTAGAVIVIVLLLLLFQLLNNINSRASSQFAITKLEAAITQKPEPTEEEKRVYEAVNLGASRDDPDAKYLPTPLLASYGELMIHVPIVPRDITEIEFHQASYDTSLPLTPLVTMVDADAVAEAQGTNHIPYEDQPYGEVPLVAESFSTWRMFSEGAEMTAVDTGATAGKYAYAPITGTVVRIKEYTLFEQMQDLEIHIQSPNHPNLDVVVLHVDNLMVNVGDKVVGGCTRIGTVKSIGDVIDNNLSNFTAIEDPGNHCHVQVNDATREEYKGLEGALDIFDGKGYVKPEPTPIELGQ